MNLFFALAWLLAGVGILVWQYTTHAQSLFIWIGDTPVSAGWFALVLAVYNVVRWWSVRAYRKQAKAATDAWQERMRRRRHPDRTDRPATPDPTFDFSDKPASPEQNEPTS
jgi:hypothetical protein